MTQQPVVRLTREEDLLALVPYTFGFHPHESMVLVAATRDGRTFSARLDLPDDLDTLEQGVRALVVSAQRNHARLGMVVLYTKSRRFAAEAARHFSRALVSAGIELVLAIRADGRSWFSLLDGHRARGAVEGDVGTPYDVESHVLTARRVVEGKVTYGSREDLAGSLAVVDEALAERVRERLQALPPLGGDEGALRFEARWLRRLLQRASADGVPPVEDDLPRLLRAIQQPDLRDVAWCEVDRASAEREVPLWVEVVRRCPPDLVAPAAGILALTAWLQGNGALAWCAVELVPEAHRSSVPGASLLQIVAGLLERAVNPSEWTPPGAGSVRLLCP